MNGRSRNRLRALRRRTALASAVLMVGTLLQAVVQPAAAADEDKGRPAAPRMEKPVDIEPVKVKPRPVQKGPRTPRTAPDAAWPRPASATVRLAAPGTGKATAPVQVKGMPLALANPRAGKKTPAAGGDIEARLLSRKTAQRAGIDGLLFSLRPKEPKAPKTSPASGAPKASEDRTPEATPRHVQTQVDYGKFADAFGGAYASRLTLVELPACALTDPEAARCRTAEPVATVNSAEKQTLTAKSVRLSASSPTVLAAVAAQSSDRGDYKATPLSPSAAWSTNLNTGDFTWSYGIDVPEVPGGLKPNLSLGYSSGGVDGRTGNTNNQASWVGDGFDLAPGFIERRYKSCADDGNENADGSKPADQCWAYDNAFLSFNGKGGELVQSGTDTWKLKNDDGTIIQRRYSTQRGNGDDDGEFWQLTDPKGVRYYFGFNRLPGWADGKETTDSTWTVPVYGDDSGEKCHGTTFADSWCDQGWRWNLDYVVDPRGNAVAYYYNKETNHYGRNLKAADDTPYTRGGTLDRVEYGLKSSSMYGTKALAKVDFADGERCIPDASTTCSSIETDGFYWYDTPWDLNCDAGTDCDQGRLAPSFFTRKLLSGVTTQVYDAASSTYKNVDSWKLNHRWGMADTDYQLLLQSVERTGHGPSTSITLPKTEFTYTDLANRLDKTGDGFAPFIKSRLATITDEYGGQIDVGYSAAACDWAALPTPQSNTTRCFPQYIGGDTTSDPEQHWFNKYVVNSVTATDRTGGAPDQVTRYSYLGGAAWHFDDDDGLTKEKFKTWSQWRGYGHVRVQTGGQQAMKSQSDSYFLRGMDGDRAGPSGGTKSESVTLGAGEGEPITDHQAAAGFAYKTEQYSGPSGNVLSKTVNRPWYHETARKTRSWGTVTANFTGTGRTTTFTSLDNGAGQQWRTVTGQNRYDTVAGRLIEADDWGDGSKADDSTCTRTSYPADPQGNILTLPTRVETVSKACDETVSRPADVMSDVRTVYDGGAYNQAPTKGDVTSIATLKDYDGATAVYRESQAGYDGYGRMRTSTDRTADVRVTSDGTLTRLGYTDGRTTTTVPEPTTGFATSVQVTTPPADPANAATAQTTTTKYELLRGLQTSVTDTNGKVTNYAYDALGRVTKTWLADRLQSQTPNYQYDYTVVADRPVAVGTRTLGNNGVQQTAWTFYDGFLRPRQTQNHGPAGGRLLSDTFYDDRGLVAKEFAPYYANGAPVNYPLSKPEDALDLETQNHYTYDGLGRVTESWQKAGNSDGGTDFGRTRTIYKGDRTTVIPPVGGTATTTLVDARGRTTELHQHHQRGDSGEVDKTLYQYSPRGELTKLTDPSGATWENEYNLSGHKVRTVDPDKGTTTSTYDERGLLVSSTDARGTVLAYRYDGLGRRTELHKDSLTGPLRAKWVYDTVDGAKGHLAESIRYENGQAYSSKVELYDRLYRPKSTYVTIPTGEGALQGSYYSGTSYDPSGAVQSVSYPKAGALPGQAFSFTYQDKTLWPTHISGGSGTRSTTSYSPTGKPWQHELSHDTGKKTWVTNTYEWGTQRLATSRVEREGVAGVDQSNTYKYDEAGNVLSVSDTSRDGTDNQCFTYDAFRRLKEAWSQGTTGCATAPATSALGGPAPYWHSYSYNKAGQRLTETLHDPSGDTAKNTNRTYNYPAAGQPQPHTLTSVNSTGLGGSKTHSYAYDATGNTTSRPQGDKTQTLTWDPEGHLTKVTEPDGSGGQKTTEYLYDADGNRLIGRTPTETTLYLGHTEVVLPKGSATPRATRYIDLGGGHQAVAKDDGTVSLTLADHHGTAQLAVDAATQKLTQRRTLPFGGIRGTTPTDWPGTKGFVGGTNDGPSTGLTHLGAREYDSSLGQFVSVDPLLEIDRPQTLNGYSYSTQNPVSFSDPTGLSNSISCKGSSCGEEAQFQDSWVSPPIDSNVSYADAYPNYPGNNGKTQASSGQACDMSGCRTWHFGLRWEPTLPWVDGRLTGSGGKDFPVGDAMLAIWAPGYFIAKPDYESVVRCGGNLGANWTCLSAALEMPTPLKAGKALKIPGKLSKVVGGIAGFFKKSGCKCFLAGTDVLLADGKSKDIEDVRVGDKVLATDPQTGKTEPRAVTHLIRTEDDKKFNELSITTKTGVELLTATHEHPFWSPSEKRWVPAADLKVGMSLRTDRGDHVVVSGNRPFTKHARTYNLTVGGIHTYYVLAGETPVLVHNSDCPTSAASGERLRRQLSEEAGRLSNVRTADDIFDTPSALRGGVTPDQVRPFFIGQKGWVEEGLGRGRNAGGGWVIREYTDRGDPTGRMLRWNPGGGHHGPGAYWRVVGAEGDLGGIIR